MLGTYFDFSSPKWSPDGKTLFYVADDGRVSGVTIRRIELSNGKQSDIIYHPRGLDVSPVEDQLAYVTFSNGPTVTGNGLAKANLDGSNNIEIIPIVNNIGINGLCWTKDGKRVLFGKNPLRGENRVDWVSIDDKQTGIEIASLTSPVRALACSPVDDRFVYEIMDRLFIYDPETRTSVDLTNGSQPTWGVKSEVSATQCGSWKWVGTTKEKDLRIQTILVTESSGNDCRGAFRLHNDTDILGFGGYSFEIQTKATNAHGYWVPNSDHSSKHILLTPLLDTRLQTAPINPSANATLFLSGDLTLYSFTIDLSTFLIRAGLEFSPPGVACFIPEETLLFTSIQVSNILVTTAELTLKGDYEAAWDEFLQIADHFYEQSGEVMGELGYECATDALKALAEKPVVIFKIAVDYLTWVGSVIGDYFKYDGQSANISLAYVPPAPPSSPTANPNPTQVITFLPTGITDETLNGSCWTFSIASPRNGSWRCMSNGRIYDPCFSPEGEAGYVICGAVPLGNISGFKMNLIDPLPKDEPPAQTSSVLALELEGSTTCRFLTTGTAFEIEGKYYNYGCSDGSILLELEPGQVWTATKAHLSADKSSILNTSKVIVRLVWI